MFTAVKRSRNPMSRMTWVPRNWHVLVDVYGNFDQMTWTVIVLAVTLWAVLICSCSREVKRNGLNASKTLTFDHEEVEERRREKKKKSYGNEVT